ncbi:hypothetical protein BHM03_00013656, partial [Ensete ventricosum]
RSHPSVRLRIDITPPTCAEVNAKAWTRNPTAGISEAPSEYSHLACFKHCHTQAHAFTAVMDLLGRAQRCHDCIRALEEELKEIEAFQRELPLCLHLVNLSFAASRFPSGLFR